MSLLSIGGAAGCAVLERRDAGGPIWRWWRPMPALGALPPLADLRPGASFTIDETPPL